MNTPCPWEDSLEQRTERGQRLVEQLWWSLAKRIVQLAGTHYKWDDDQWRAATELFLRPNDYSVLVKYDDGV